ncbi:MAG: SsrA-binding protein SmpB [Caldithrix sp.]|nr:SsrA-binding protein SmpB [Caldithrix sp.]
MPEENIRVIATNRKAKHDYQIQSTLEAGIALQGKEVKSVREGRVNLKDSYARFKMGELWLIGLHISQYKNAPVEEHEPLRDRKLLLKKSELRKLFRQTEEKGVTLIPLKIYFRQHLVKIELALAHGKRKYDKRAAIAEKDMKRDLAREQKYNN